MKRLLVTLIIGLCLFSSCNENEWNESVLQTFKLISVQFTPTDEPMEEIFGEPNVTTFENKSDKEKPFVLTRKVPLGNGNCPVNIIYIIEKKLNSMLEFSFFFVSLFSPQKHF